MRDHTAVYVAPQYSSEHPPRIYGWRYETLHNNRLVRHGEGYDTPAKAREAGLLEEVLPCTHNQRWEHWIPLFHNNERGKVLCGSKRDVFVDTERECKCPEGCECRWSYTRTRKSG